MFRRQTTDKTRKMKEHDEKIGESLHFIAAFGGFCMQGINSLFSLCCVGGRLFVDTSSKEKIRIKRKGGA